MKIALPIAASRLNHAEFPRLNVLYATFGSLAHFGIRPHCKLSEVRCLVLWVESNRENILSRRDVPTDRQIPLRRYRDVIPASQFFF
jgi:hypothetical protein